MVCLYVFFVGSFHLAVCRALYNALVVERIVGRIKELFLPCDLEGSDTNGFYTVPRDVSLTGVTHKMHLLSV